MTKPDFPDTFDVFPSNVVQLVHARVKQKWPSTGAHMRPLRHTDKVNSIGIFPSDWTPDVDSYEFPQVMESRPAGFPTVQMYLITVQAFVKDMNPERGIRVHSLMSKAIRSLLYHDKPLAVGLQSLRVEMDGVSEVIQRRYISRQKYISNEIDGSFLYLSTLQYSIETESK